MHELTKRLNQIIHPELCKVIDSIIRQWLSEKAKEFATRPDLSYQQILGIQSEVKEPWKKEQGCGCLTTFGENSVSKKYCLEHEPKTTFDKPVEDKVEKWCEHIVDWNYKDRSGAVYIVGHTWQFCPICGTHRPVSKTQKEVLAEKLAKHNGSNYEASPKWWNELAEIAEKHFKEQT